MVNSRAVLALYRGLLRTGSKFHDFNFREYAIRRTKESFRESVKVVKAEDKYQEGLRELASLRRQVAINNMYAVETPSVFGNMSK